MFNNKSNIRHEVRARVKRKDGTIEDLGVIAIVQGKKKKNNLIKAFGNLTKKILGGINNGKSNN